MAGSEMSRYDLVVLGGGPAGVSGAIAAGMLGRRVALIEKEAVVHLGLLAMMMNATADLFQQTCFNYPTLGDLYKYATYDAVFTPKTR
jgi:pyruvate/2-oxoglutarate dehydrogenase complex dihydrolipoamide dehydrogenase (E3) component